MIPDWCEPNYVWSTYIAEWWNAWSSLAYVCLGLLGARRFWHSDLPRIHRNTYVALIFIGIGSFAFHATLSRAGQLADELSMINCVYCGHLSLARKEKERMFVACLWCVAIMFYVIGEFYAFATNFGLSLLFLAISFAKQTRKQEMQKARIMGQASIALFLIAFFLFWLPEHVLCVVIPLQDRGFIQRVPLHAAWHILSAVGAYIAIITGILARTGTVPDKRVGRLDHLV